ncbi:hypothetical protein [Lactobacillus taiwanensis]|uniref:hypothetical protein n=1 Tax=Lactobacillus taiwanensis TaxID=508451 RepID=UPI00261B6420
MKLEKEILNTELLDDNTLYGGVSFRGETVEDFIAECGIDPQSIEDLNESLIECGIKPL